MAIWDPVVDLFSAEDANAYDPNKEKFKWGGGGVDQGALSGAYREIGAGYRNASGPDYTAATGSQSDAKSARAAGMVPWEGQLNAANAALGYSEDDSLGGDAAAAQFRQATNENIGNALAMARSGRGLGGSQAAMSQAIAQNANTGQQAANQSAIMAAEQARADRAMQLQALGVAQQGYGAAGNYMLGQQGADTAMAGQQIQQAQYGTDYDLAAGQLGLAYDREANTLEQQQLEARIEEERIRSGNVMGAQGTNIASDNERDSGMIGMIGGAIGAMSMLSDEREKTDKKRTSAAEAFRDLSLDYAGIGDQYRAGVRVGKQLFGDEKLNDEEAEERYGLNYEPPKRPPKNAKGVTTALSAMRALSDRREKRVEARALGVY